MVESTKSQVLHFDDRQGEVPFRDAEACDRELCTKVSRKCLLCRKETEGLSEKMDVCFRVVFQNMDILVDDISDFEIERMII